MLSDKERYSFCKQCQKRKFDMKKGILCSVTNAKPDFYDTCENYIVDTKEADKIAKGGVKDVYGMDGSTSNISAGGWFVIILGSIGLILRIVLMLMR